MTIILTADMLCERFVISVTTSIKIRKRFFYLSNVFLHHNACEGRNLRMRVGRKSIKIIAKDKKQFLFIFSLAR